METPIIDQMLKSLEWQTKNSSFTTQRNIDLVAELKWMKEQLILSGVSKRRELLIADMIKMIKSYTDEEVNLVCKQRNEMYGSNLQWLTPIKQH